MYAIATLSLPLAPRSADNFPRQCFNFAPLLRTARSRPTTFFSPPSVAPSTRREGLGADDKMLKLSPLLAFFAPSLEDRWKPLEPSSRASRSCLKCIRLFTLASRVHSFVIPRQANHFYLYERTESLTVRFKFELIFPPVLFLSRRRERSSGVVNSFWWSERDFFPSRTRQTASNDKDEEILSRVGHAPATRTRWYTISRPSWYLPKSLDTSVARIIKDTTATSRHAK